jgi:site-specific DNA recombinase
VKTAAIYARVSSDRQKEEQTITSQTSALRAYAAEHGYLVPEGWVYEDEGWSGAPLVRPGLERVRDLAAQGQVDSLLVYSPDRLSRTYAYQVLLLEEFARAGVDVVFVRAPRVETPEEVLLVQFQGMIAEYEKAQISERTRRGKRHRARCGVVNVLSGAPYGYRYVRKAEGEPARYEVLEPEAAVVRDVFRRYTEDAAPIGAITRWLTDSGIPTRTGKPQWERSTIWGILRNPAYQGTACFQKTAMTPREHVRVTRRLRQRGGVPVHPASLRDRPREEWIEIPVPALVSPTQYALAQARLAENRRFAARHTKIPSLLQGLLVCRSCGYAYYRTSTRTSRRRLFYSRCLGSDDYRYPEGRRCTNRPVRQDALDALVWAEVIRLLENPSLVRQEIERRLAALRTEQPITVKRESLVKTLGRIRGAIARLIEAYQEELLSLEELRTRMPPLRQREVTAEAQVAAFETELTDAETYVTLAQSLEGFLAKLREAAHTLALADRQRVVRLILKEVQVGPDTLVLRHSIPVPGNHPDPGYLLRGRSHHPTLRRAAERAVELPFFQVSGLEEMFDQPEKALVEDLFPQDRQHDRMVKPVKTLRDIPFDEPHGALPFLDLCQGGMTPMRGPKAVGESAELRLVVRLQDGAHHLLQQLVRPGRESQRALLRGVLLRDVDSPDWRPPITLLSERIDDRLDFRHRHPVHRFRCHARSQRTLVASDPMVGPEVQRRVVQLSVHVVQPLSLHSPCANDAQHSFGSPHLAYLPVLASRHLLPFAM